MKNLTVFSILIVVGALQTACPFTGAGDECRVLDESWCESGQVKMCAEWEDGDGGTFNVIRNGDGCADVGLTCVELSPRTGNATDPGSAACIEPCDADTAPRCDDAGALEVCAPFGASATELADVIAAWSTTGAAPPFTAAEPLAIQDTGLDCSECDGSCECPLGALCQGGLCLPGDDSTLVCCGRERGRDCLNGAECVQSDGSAGTCVTNDRCQSCAADADCATGSCADPGGYGAPICLDASDTFFAIRFECMNERELWARDDCDRWIAIDTTCTPDTHCAEGRCLANVPEISVAPTLLDFGDVMVGTTAMMTLSIGNPGFAPLNVSAIAADAAGENVVTFSASNLTVDVGAIVEVDVSFTPVAAGSVSSRLTISSDAFEMATVTVLMNGDGI